QTTGLCDGKGACSSTRGTECQAPSCASGGTTLVNARQCDDSGTCAASTTSPCLPYVCEGLACRTTFTSDTHCLSGYYCNLSTNKCETVAGQGQACKTSGQCPNGNCVDGFCCNSACTGGCMACSKAKKGYGNDGVCEAIQAGTDPNNECPKLAASTCSY